MFTLKTSSLLKNVPKTLTKVLALTLMVSAPLSLAQSEESVGWPEKEELKFGFITQKNGEKNQIFECD